MNPWRNFLPVITWLTRFAGATIAVGGLGFFASAWTERSVTLAVMGVVTIAVGAIIKWLFALTKNGSLEYRLVRSNRWIRRARGQSLRCAWSRYV